MDGLPSFLTLDKLVHMPRCFWAAPREVALATDAFFFVFCLGMWVPAGQAIGESSVRGQVHTVELSLCVHWGLVLGGDYGFDLDLDCARRPTWPILTHSFAGGYGPPPAGRGAPPPPPPFTSYIVSTPPGGFPPPQGFPQGYGAPPQFSECYPNMPAVTPSCWVEWPHSAFVSHGWLSSWEVSCMQAWASGV